ncbi:uncharacterized protein [Euwallacea fornicatus]|uniref:uncharacterized protein n=1 Tax=Euwallacea fornicatus TaxID=995702 RepID=UPI00338F792A
MKTFRANNLCLLVLILGVHLIKSDDSGNDTDVVDLPAFTSESHPTSNEEVVPPFVSNTPNMGFPEDFPPPLHGVNNLPPNIFQFFTQLFKPAKFTEKTYGPNIIAIIGDKPYISMEIFNKFSPFKWLMHAFQGKIQNICGLLTSLPGDGVGNVPENIFSQFEEPQQRPTTVPNKSTIYASLPVRIYDIPVGHRHSSKQS